MTGHVGRSKRSRGTVAGGTQSRRSPTTPGGMLWAAGPVRSSVGRAAVYRAGQPGKQRHCAAGPGRGCLEGAWGQVTPGGRHKDGGLVRAASEWYGVRLRRNGTISGPGGRIGLPLQLEISWHIRIVHCKYRLQFNKLGCWAATRRSLTWLNRNHYCIPLIEIIIAFL
jgi:hypothetical protein